MQIHFSPSIGQEITVSPLLLASHISTCTAVRFTAVVDDSEYEQISRDGGKLQLWSNNPDIDGNEWQEHNFIEDTNNLTTGTRQLSLCLSVILPPRVDKVELPYTYRISYPDGRVKWLGEYGQNGICVVSRQSSRLILCDRWRSKDDDSTLSLDASGSSKALLNVLGGLNPSSYHLHAFDSDGSDSSMLFAHSEAVVLNCSMVFIVPKHAPDSHIIPQAFVISSSLGNSISLSATGDISIDDNAENSLLLQVYDPRTDLRSIVEMAITHSLSGRWRALSIDRQNSLAVLATTSVHCPMHLVAIGLSAESNIQTTEAEIEQRDLEMLFTESVNSICVYPPFETGVDSISRDDAPGCNAKRVLLAISTRYIISPEYNLRSRAIPWRISVLSDHTNVHAPLEQQDVRLLPTPPPSPLMSVKRPSASASKKRWAQLARYIANVMANCVRYWFTVIFFPIVVIFYILSVLRRLNNAKKNLKIITSEENTGRSLSLRVPPGQLTILLRSGDDDVATEHKRRALCIRFDGKELDGFVERNADRAVLLTTLIDKEGDIEISAI